MATLTDGPPASAGDMDVLRLWQLISPGLPVGAYAYSEGLEYAVHAGWVCDEESASDWILGQMQASVARVDVPVLARLHRAWSAGDGASVSEWSRYLQATRSAAELLAADRQLGSALARLLADLGIDAAAPWVTAPERSFACLFALACVHWRIPVAQAARGYLWAWTENQVAAAIKLVPLGQTAGQRLLLAAGEHIVAAVRTGLALEDGEIGGVAPGVAIASALHESQYTRLFRS